jgi:hypothetical protein
VITPQEQQELRVARTEALKANPKLIVDQDKLAERMQAFEEKLDAAMIKHDPTIAPLIAKLKPAHAQALTTSPTPAGAPPTSTPPLAK